MPQLRFRLAGLVVCSVLLASISGASRNPTAETNLAPAPGSRDNLALGNPSAATADLTNKNNFLIEKEQYTTSYNNKKGGPNWVSWHLAASDLGGIPRMDAFRPDPTLPAGFTAITPSDYATPLGVGVKRSKYDRGHMCPSGDRTATEIDNCATFFMTNMMPQTPDLNEHVWEGLEEDARSLALNGFELYIIAGGIGVLEPVGPKTGPKKVTAPTRCWKIIVVLPEGDNDLKRVDANTRVIAVNMPNKQGIAKQPWQNFIVTVRSIEQATGFNFLSKVPQSVQDVIETKKDSGVLGVPKKAIPPDKTIQRVPCVD